MRSLLHDAPQRPATPAGARLPDPPDLGEVRTGPWRPPAGKLADLVGFLRRFRP